MAQDNGGFRQPALPEEKPRLAGGRELKIPSPNIRIAENWRTIALGAAILVFGLGIFAVIWLLRRPLAILALGVVIAEALAPVVGWLERKLPRIAAVLLVYLALLVVVGGIMYLVVPTFVNQAQMAIDAAPGMIERFQSWLSHLNLPFSQSLAGTLKQQLAAFAASLLTLPLTIISSLFDLVLILFISVYWLVQSPGMHRYVLSLLPPGRREGFDSVSGHMGQAMGGYLRGTAINGLILGSAVYLALTLLGVGFPLVLGLTTGLLEFVPVVGATVSVVLIELVALSQSTSLALITLPVLLLLHQFEAHVLVPNIMHSQTDISPLLVVLAVFAGATLGGLLGAIISIPLVAALQVFLKEVATPWVRRRTGAEPIEETEHE